MEFKNIIVGNNVYGDNIKLQEIAKNFDYGKLTRRYEKKDPLPSKADSQFFDSRGINYELSGNADEMESYSEERKISASAHKKEI